MFTAIAMASAIAWGSVKAQAGVTLHAFVDANGTPLYTQLLSGTARGFEGGGWLLYHVNAGGPLVPGQGGYPREMDYVPAWSERWILGHTIGSASGVLQGATAFGIYGPGVLGTGPHRISP